MQLRYRIDTPSLARSFTKQSLSLTFSIIISYSPSLYLSCIPMYSILALYIPYVRLYMQVTTCFHILVISYEKKHRKVFFLFRRSSG